MTMISLENVSFTYQHQPEIPALTDFSLQIEKGEMVVLAGLSGSGKSTVCRLIAGYAPHQFVGTLEGTVTVNGIDVPESSIGELSQHVGVVFEDPFDQLTGTTQTLFDEVAFALEHRAVDPDEIAGRVIDALTKVDLGEIYDRHPRQLSGGQSQRLAIATVLALEPAILILDGPTSQLDPVGSEEVAGLIEVLRNTGMTIVVVAHDLERWLYMADRLVCMDDGRVTGNGVPRDILAGQLHSGLLLPPAASLLWDRFRAEGVLSTDASIALTIDELTNQLLGDAVHD